VLVDPGCCGHLSGIVVDRLLPGGHLRLITLSMSPSNDCAP
jgi:hypothetical protein